MAPKKRGRPPSKAASPKKEPQEAAPKKKAKVAEEATLDPFSEACQEVLTLLDQDDSLTEATREMLRAAVPFSLKPIKEDRHQFQEALVQSLDAIIKTVEGKERGKVEAAQSKIDEASSSVRTATETLSASAAKVEELTAARDASDQAVKDAVQAAEESKEALQAAKEAAEGVEAENANNVAELTARQLLMDDTWVALKAGNFSGRQWRERAKKIESISNVLVDLDVEGSLLCGVPVALKAKPEDRGYFALKAIEFAEESLNKSLETIREKIAAHSTEVEAHAKRIAEAQDAVDKKTDALGTRQNEFVASENNLLKAKQEKEEAAEVVQNFDEKSKELQAAVAEQQQALADVCFLKSKFEALAAGGAASLDTATTCAAEAPAAVEEVPAAMDAE